MDHYDSDAYRQPDNGFTTSLELEVRIDDFEMDDSSQWRTFKFAKWNNAVSLCEFSKNGENSKNDDLPTVWNAAHTRSSFQVSSLTKERYNRARTLTAAILLLPMKLLFVRCNAKRVKSGSATSNEIRTGGLSL